MVNGIGGSGAGKAAMEAALKTMRERSVDLGARPSGTDDAAAASGAPNGTPNGTPGFADVFKDGLGAVETQVNRTNEIHLDVLKGKLDLHEVAAQLKESEITFQFALTVRNKLIDAYREVMRMSV